LKLSICIQGLEVNTTKEKAKLILIARFFLTAYFVPWNDTNIRQAGFEAFMMLRKYAREHMLNCLIPAFFIAVAISVLVSQTSGRKYFGAQTNLFTIR